MTPQIASSNAKQLFTKQLFDVVNIVPPVSKSLLKDFEFQYSPVQYISWQQRRWKESVAKTVIKGGTGNLNKASMMTEQIEQAPNFHEVIYLNNLRGFNQAFGSINPSESAMADYMTEVALEVGQIKNKIVRAYNLMAAQVMMTGTVTTDTFSYDFKRNPASFDDLGAGNYWDNNSVSPFTIIETGIEFLVKYGKNGGGVFDCIMGSDAWNAFLENTKVLDRSQKLWSVLTEIEKPAMDADGMVFHGQISAGAYKVNIYTYARYYTDDTEYQPTVTVQGNYRTYTQASTPNTSLPYIDRNKIVIKPIENRQLWAATLVERLPSSMLPSSILGGMGMGETDGGLFYAYDFEDVKQQTWEFNIKSSGLTIPIRIDNYFTATVMPAV